MEKSRCGGVVVFLKGVDIFLTYEAKCYRFHQSKGLMSWIEIPQLCSDHEEADTCMVAYVGSDSMVHGIHSHMVVMQDMHQNYIPQS